MSIEIELTQRARDLADAMGQHRVDLAKRKADLEEQLHEVNAEIASEFDIDERLAGFQIKVGDDFQCPYCWMYDRAQRALVATSRGAEERETDSDADFFRCHTCNSFYSGAEG